MTTYKKLKLLKTLEELLRENQLDANKSDALQYVIELIKQLKN